MASISTTFLATANRILTAGSLLIDDTIVTAASMMLTDETTKSTAAFAIIGTNLGSYAHKNHTSILAAGYIGGGQILSWEGRMVGQPEEHIFAEIYADDPDQVKLTITGKRRE